ncbi:MAG TPA: hypothetical protein VF487_13655 [Chitinophagaceae bacterium]
MEQIRLPLERIDEIKTLYHTGWLVNDSKGKEIVLEDTKLDHSDAYFKAVFITLSEGVLNSNPNISPEKITHINYDDLIIPDFPTLVNKLTEVTGIKFSYALTKSD